MKRLHVHVSVDDLPASIRFYNTLFASQTAVIRDDYAKWMLDDPRVNFAISKRMTAPASVTSASRSRTGAELADVYSRFSTRMRRYWKKAAPAAATRSARRAGSPTPRASGGRRSMRQARAKIIAMR